MLPCEIPLPFIDHKSESDTQDIHCGQELDAEISETFAERFTALVAYACFESTDRRVSHQPAGPGSGMVRLPTFELLQPRSIRIR